MVYLYESVEAAAKGATEGGSGFVVAVPSERVVGRHFLYAVTASHVVREGSSPVVRVNRRDGTTRVVATTPDEWEHSETDDVAISGLPKELDDDVSSILVDDLFVSLATVAEFDIGPGDDVFMCGRFRGQAGEDLNRPSTRFGTIALMDAPARHGRGFTQQGALVEMRSLPGYSGSPVFVYVSKEAPRPKPAPRFYWGLLGLDWAHVDHEELVRDRDRQLLKGEMLGWHVRQNSGMARVLPAWKIREFLHREDFREGRRLAEA